MTEMTLLLTLSVYQLMIRTQLPNKSGAIPIIGQLLMYTNLTDVLPSYTSITVRWRRGVALECRTCDQKSWVRVSAGHYGVKTLGKFLIPMCLCHQAVKLGTGESSGE